MTSGDVTLHVPRLKGVSFETAIIGRYRRRESGVEEALIEMYLAGVSVRRVEDITEALWGSKVSPATISELNKKAYVHIEDWRNRPLQGSRYLYVYVDGIEETLTYCDFPSEHWTRNPHQQRDRATEPRDPPQNPRGWDVPGRELRPHAGLRPVSPCDGHPVGQQEIHEHEAFRGGHGQRLHCRLTSFNRSLQTILRINLDGAREAAYHPRPAKALHKRSRKLAWGLDFSAGCLYLILIWRNFLFLRPCALRASGRAACETTN